MINWFSHSGRNSPLRGARAYQPTAGLTFTCAQTEVNDNPVSLRVTYGQHVEPPSPCSRSRPELHLQIRSYPKFSLCWIGTDSIHGACKNNVSRVIYINQLENFSKIPRKIYPNVAWSAGVLALGQLVGKWTKENVTINYKSHWSSNLNERPTRERCTSITEWHDGELTIE